MLSHISCVRLSVTTWTVAHQSPLCMGFSRQEYCNGLPCPSPGDLPNLGIEPGSPTLQADSLATKLQGKIYKGVLALPKRCSTQLGLPEAHRSGWSQVSQGCSLRINSVQFSHSVMSDSLQSHGLQHARPPCPSPTPRAYSNSCLSSR